MKELTFNKDEMSDGMKNFASVVLELAKSGVYELTVKTDADVTIKVAIAIEGNEDENTSNT